MNKVIALIAIIVVIIAGWLMLRDSGVDTGVESLNPVTNTQQQNPVGNNSSTVQSGSLREFVVTSSGLSFDPKQITVKKGDTVRITYINTIGTHDLVIDEFDAKTKQLNAGEKETITFVADKSGTFEYYCSVGNHRQQGMVGKLTVN